MDELNTGFYNEVEITALAECYGDSPVISWNSSMEFKRVHVDGELFAKQTVDREQRKTGSAYFLCNRFKELVEN